MRWISYLLVVLLFNGCTKKSNFSLVEVVGHAGMGLSMGNSMFHDNSKEAIEFALQMPGCDGVEVDVQLSMDGDLWLYHDAKLETETTSEGCINSRTNEELQGVRYKSLHQEKLIRLSDLNPALLMGKILYLDIRHTNTCLNQVITAGTLINALNTIDFLHQEGIQVRLVTNNSILISQLLDAFYVVYYDAITFDNAQSILLNNPLVQGIVIRNAAINKEEVQAIKISGKKVVLYEMRSAVGIRKALNKNPDSIMPDDLREAIIETN